MDPIEPTIMQKETLVKDDGRTLIYYRFVPESSLGSASDSSGTPAEPAAPPAGEGRG